MLFGISTRLVGFCFRQLFKLYFKKYYNLLIIFDLGERIAQMHFTYNKAERIEC